MSASKIFNGRQFRTEYSRAKKTYRSAHSLSDDLPHCRPVGLLQMYSFRSFHYVVRLYPRDAVCNSELASLPISPNARAAIHAIANTNQSKNVF